MLRQTLQLFVVVVGVAFAMNSRAQEQDWNVQGDARRDAKIVKRYRQLLLRNPDQTLVYRSLLSRLGRGPGLDPFIEQIREVATSSHAAEPWILLGHLTRDRGRAAESLAAYQKAVQCDATSAAAHAAFGEALDAAGHDQAADAAFERALGLSSSPASRRKLLRRLADLALARPDFRRAIQWMQALVDEVPRDYGLRVELAETQLRGHRFDAALRSYEVAYELAGRSGKRRAQALLDIGNLHRRMHDPASAERSYRKALSLAGRSSWMRREILMRLVDVARDLRTLPAMVAELRREWGSPNYHDSMVLAGLYEELGQDAEAIRWLERAARLDRRAIEPRTRLLARLDHQNDAARVRELYDEIVALRPDDLVQRLERIEWLFFRAQRAQEALAQLRTVTEQVSDDPDSLVQVAGTYRRFGLADAALVIHRELLKSHPRSAVNLEAYGELLSKLGRAEEAEQVWERLFALDPDDVHSRLRVAEIAARLRDYDKACELLEGVVQRYPRLVDARQRLAGAYEAQQRWREALEQWETLFFDDEIDHAGRRIVAIAKRNVFLGDDIVTTDRGLLQRWETHYQNAPAPRTATVLIRLRAEFGQHDEALKLARSIADADPASLDTSEHGAWIDAAQWVVEQTQRRDPHAAIEVLARIAEAFGDQRATSWRKAVDVAVTFPDEEAVVRVLDRALAAVPHDPYVHATAGIFFGAHGARLRAITHLRRAIELGANNFDVHFDLAFHLKEAGRVDEAREVYLDVVRSDASGSWAPSAAFSAIDLCRSDAHLRQLADEIAALRGRLPEDAFYSVVVATYQELFLYAQDPSTAFEALGRGALPLLVGAMQAEAEEDRARAAGLLQLYPGEQVARTALRTWPRDAGTWSPEMVWTLGRTRAAVAGASLIAALDSRDEDVRHVALFSIGFARVPAAVAPLAAALGDEDLRAPALSLITAALGRIGTDEAVRVLARFAAREGGHDERLYAMWALGQARSDGAAAALAERLADPSDEVGHLAGVMLSRLASDHGLRALLRAAWDTDPVRRAVARRGLRSGVAADDVWGYDDPRLQHPQHLIELALADAMRDPGDKPTARAFVGREATVVDTARETLAAHGPLVLEHLVAVAQEIETNSDAELAPSIRRVVLGLRPNLRKLTRSNDTRTVVSAALLLPIAQQPEDAALVARVAGSLPQREGDRVVERLSTYPWKSVRPTLLAGLRSGEPERRAASLRALSRTFDAKADEEAVSLIEQLATDSDPEVQVAAIEALGELQREESAQMLADLYERAPAPTQRAIRSALSRMDGDIARAAAQRIAIEPTLPVCDGDQNDLADLLRDACAGAVEISDF